MISLNKLSVGEDTYRMFFNIEYMFSHEKSIDQMVYDAKLAAMKYIVHYRKWSDYDFKKELQLIRNK